jgi:putative resolvase
MVVEHNDRAMRFGFRFLETQLEQQGRRIEVAYPADNGRENLLADLVAIVSSCCARLYGQLRAKRTMETIVRDLIGQDALVVDEREQEVIEDAPG